MKNSAEYTKKLNSLLRTLSKSQKPAPLPDEDVDPVTRLVISFLQWNARRPDAMAAHKRIMSVMVDNNDLRVSHVNEVVSFLGDNYPRAEERVARMLEALQEIFVREHAVTLDHLSDKPKKDVRAYLESLPGMPSYVAARVTLLGFGGHAIPVDDRLSEALKGAGAVDPEASIEEVQGFLERHIKATDGLDMYLLLDAWSDTRAGSRRSAAAKTVEAGKKTTKKRTSKKPARKK
ncbi:MAG: hypothetical protein GC164_08210 [Phycisphaera sp.]|nr:hypothetical protein [Phycisphaera sp.]